MLREEVPNNIPEYTTPPEQIDSPPLEQRFLLMQVLCKSIYYLHLGELVHKGIRSENVIFFRQELDNSIRISEPYITGFDHSRPDGPNDVTTIKAALSPEEDRYRHPMASTSMSRRSTKIHDLYSLALVLMEIAHWVKLKDLVGYRNGEAVMTYVLSDEGPVKEIDYIAGTRLRDLVYRCLRGRFDVNLDDQNSAGLLQDIFLRDIVGGIMKCSV